MFSKRNENKNITVQEAKALTIDAEIEKLFKEIKDIIASGNFSYVRTGKLSAAAERLLKTLGYSIKETGHTAGENRVIHTKISWYE